MANTFIDLRNHMVTHGGLTPGTTSLAAIRARLSSAFGQTTNSMAAMCSWAFGNLPPPGGGGGDGGGGGGDAE